MIDDKNFNTEFVSLMRTIYSKDAEEASFILRSFYSKYIEKDFEGKLRSSINLTIGHIYFNNSEYEKALVIFEELLKEMPRESVLFTTILEKIANILILRENKAQAFSYLDDYLKKEQFYWNSTLVLLKLLLINGEFGRLKRYKSHIAWIAKEVGVGIAHINELEDVALLVKENSAANQRFSQISISISNVPSEEKKEILQKYIEQENVGFYRGMAVAIYQNA